MSLSLETPLIFSRLASAERVLIAGAGGGFDVYAGLPIALALHRQGKQVVLANVTFTNLSETDAEFLTPALAAVTPTTDGADSYFPERTLARWLSQRGLPWPVYAFEKTGVRPLRSAYRALVERHRIDAVVLVDGGTDILMRGDEAGLGTPEEDITSLAAVAGLELGTRLVASIGFGIDAYHGVCHAHFLENVAALERAGAYLGAFSVSRSMEEGAAFLDAVAHAHTRTPGRESIVNGSIAAAARGEFGDVQFTRRTGNSELFINPLMSIYFTFDLPGVAREVLYLDQLESTTTIWEVARIVEAQRSRGPRRERRVIPH